LVTSTRPSIASPFAATLHAMPSRSAATHGQTQHSGSLEVAADPEQLVSAMARAQWTQLSLIAQQVHLHQCAAAHLQCAAMLASQLPQQLATLDNSGKHRPEHIDTPSTSAASSPRNVQLPSPLGASAPSSPMLPPPGLSLPPWPSQPAVCEVESNNREYDHQMLPPGLLVPAVRPAPGLPAPPEHTAEWLIERMFGRLRSSCGFAVSSPPLIAGPLGAGVELRLQFVPGEAWAAGVRAGGKVSWGSSVRLQCRKGKHGQDKVNKAKLEDGHAHGP